jgi:uncharacterized protein (DUF433 family)
VCDVERRRHRSFRFAPQTLSRLEQRAKQLRVTQTALVERYVEEGLQMDDHPGIVFVDEAAGRRARVAGTGVDVWQVVETVIDNAGSTAEAAAYLAVSEVLVRRAMRYYADHPDEIDHWIESNARYAELEERATRRIADARA